MNITEASATQTLLQALTNITPGTDAGIPADLPTVEQITAAVETLAERSFNALKTGIDGEHATAALRARRGYPYRLRLAVHR